MIFYVVAGNRPASQAGDAQKMIKANNLKY